MGYLFTNNAVRAMLLLQAMCDALIIVLMANFLEIHKYVGIHPGIEISTLVTWVFASSWVMATILSFFIFGMSIINKSIFFRQLIFSTLFYAVILSVLFGMSKITTLSVYHIVMLFGATTAAIFIFRVIVFSGYKLYKYIFWQKSIVIIGCNEKGQLLEQSLLKDSSGHNQLMGYFDSTEPEDAYYKGKYLGTLNEVKGYALKNNIREIYYTLSNDTDYINDLSAFADQNFIFLGIIPDIKVQERKKIHTKYLEDVDLPVMSYEYSPLQQQMNAYTKRAFDIVFSSVVILLLGLPTIMIIGLAIKLTSPGPIFFMQKRPGKKNQIFTCYKFRTMRVNDLKELQATKNDSRITKVGAFLRKTSLDELPQFFNVLIGDMSVVGPRPNLIHHLATYKNHMPDYSLRHIVTPGITGFAQINGYRGETKEDYLMQKRVEHDMLYMQNWTLGMDMKIILQTVAQIFKPSDRAY